MTSHPPLPEIVIRAADEDRLAELANGLSTASPELAEELLAELARARLASGDALPADTRADGLDR